MHATLAPSVRDLRDSVVPALLRDEGVRLTPYRDTAGKLTIGVGRNLDDVGITDDEAMFLLEHDIDAAVVDCVRAFPWFTTLDRVRQGVIVQMRFNLGLGRLLGFQKMLAAIAKGTYRTAAVEMLESRWAVQVGDRAQRLAKAMRTGRPV